MIAVALLLPGRAALGQPAQSQPALAAPPAVAANATSPAVEPRGALRLEEALALTLQSNPELSAAAWRAEALRGRVLQAGLRPNPQLGIEMEDIAGTGEFSGVSESQTTLRLSQLVELGGKRAARIREAQLLQDVAAWDYEVKRLETLVATVNAFLDVLGLQHELGLAQEDVTLSNQVVQTSGNRVRAGSSSAAEEIRARMALAGAEVDRARLQRNLEVARTGLAAQWGSSQASFADVRGDLDTIRALPALSELQARLRGNPELARWAAEVAQRRAGVERERTLAVPDVTAGLGYRRLAGPDEDAFVLEFSVPLPLWNRNQGSVLEAQRRMNEAAQQQRAMEVRIAASLFESYQALASAREQAVSLRDRVLPGASEAFRAVNEGYQEGRFSYLEVLDAQRSLVDARTRRLQALVDYHKAVATLEKLAGGLEDLPPQPEETGDRKQEQADAKN